jgi:Trypsin-like peptidase domain
MSRRGVVLASMVLVVNLAGTTRADEPPDLPGDELARRGTEATAIIKGPTDLLSTAFCVHSDGLFVTTAEALVHPTAGEFPPTIQLTLLPGKPNQSVHVATVLRCLWNPGLALLKVDGAVGLTAPSFAPPESVEELLDVTAFDIPVRPSAEERIKRKPALVHISTGSISALQREKTELRRIQFDAPLSPGSTGGLLLDKKARVVGIIMGRAHARFGAGVGLALPVNVLDEFLHRVDLTFDPPVLTARNLLQPLDFKVGVSEFFPARRPLALELTLGGLGSGAPRHLPMTLAGRHYEAVAAPAVAPLTPATVWLEAMYKDGSVFGQVEDRAIEIAGAGSVWISELRRFRPGSRVVAQRGDGTTLFGTSVSGLGETTMTVHGQALKVDLGRAEMIAVKAPEASAGLACSIVARREGREVGRLETTIDQGDRVWPCLETLRAGRFIRPARSETPITHVSLAIGPSLPEQPLDFEEAEFQVGLRVPENFSRRDPATGKLEPVDRRGFKRGVTITFPGRQHWELVFEAPRSQELEAGVYTVAAEQDLPAASPQIKLASDVYWDPKLSARFEVWEIEVKEGVITCLALDFAGHGTGAFKNRQDFSGIVRYHSKYR